MKVAGRLIWSWSVILALVSLLKPGISSWVYGAAGAFMALGAIIELDWSAK